MQKQLTYPEILSLFSSIMQLARVTGANPKDITEGLIDICFSREDYKMIIEEIAGNEQGY